MLFFTLKRREREKQPQQGANTRLTDAILKNSDQGLFILDSTGRIMPPVSRTLAQLFRRPDFANLSFEKLLAPLVSAKTLTAVRTHMTCLLGGTWNDGEPVNVLKDIEVRLSNPEGAAETAHYAFAFDPVDMPDGTQSWLVRVTNVTAQVQTAREVEELRSQLRTQGEILRAVMRMGRARFGTFVKQTEESMKTIAAVLKKSAREEDAFRGKLEETLAEVDRIRREAAAFKLGALQQSARVFEDALHDLRGRTTLSGGDFLPLAVKLDDLYNQFALLRSLTLSAVPARDADGAAIAPGERMTDKGTQIMEAPRFNAPADDEAEADPGAETRIAPAPLPRPAPPPAGSLDNTLQSLTTHIAELEKKEVVLESSGLQLVPPRYRSVVKNVAIQLIRNAVMHGIETPAAREAAGKPLHGTLRIEFKLQDDRFELSFEDDGCGLDPEQVRATAVKRGVVTSEAAGRLRDREAIKLIFKSGFTTLEDVAGVQHGAGMSVLRRQIHDAGGKIALASLPGHETRFKITLPALLAGSTGSASPATPHEPGALASDGEPRVA
jgi:signal transduction histidine kinase